ncbi:hypothetical protein C8R48DRAFT_673189 [Suillus tomentosus]|nr:hypothetical protein C8R48DRAFT_673189 [Suillus tomentosus]
MHAHMHTREEIGIAVEIVQDPEASFAVYIIVDEVAAEFAAPEESKFTIFGPRTTSPSPSTFYPNHAEYDDYRDSVSNQTPQTLEHQLVNQYQQAYIYFGWIMTTMPHRSPMSNSINLNRLRLY